MAVIDAERLVKQGDANGHTESGDVMKLSLDEKFTQLWADDNSVETVVGLGDKEYRCKKGRRTLQPTLADHSYLLKAY